MGVRLDKFNNSWYDSGSFVKRFTWHICSNIFINTTLPFPMFIKIWVLKIFGAQIGNGLVIKPSVNIKYPWLLHVHDHVWIGENVWIDNFCIVTLESHTCVSQGAMLLTGNHDYKLETFDLIIKPITLRHGSWVGAKSVVCPGVTLGEDSILMVGSVATKNLSKNGIFQGNPATFIRNRYNY